MIVRQPHLRSILSGPLVDILTTSRRTCIRCLHHKIPAAAVPPPTPFVPDTQTFLTLIGRGLSKHADKFPTWESLFNTTSAELKEKGVDPVRTRRYLLRWREKYRRGDFGVGGDLQHVRDGMAEIRVVEIPRVKPAKDAVAHGATATQMPGMIKLPVNLPVGQTEPTGDTSLLKKPNGIKLFMGTEVHGPYLQRVKGTKGQVGVLKVQEGLWEIRRGHTVDGGERRKAEVRFKRAVEANKKARA